MRFEQPRRFLIGFGLCGVLLTGALGSLILYYGQGYYDDGYELRVEFESAAQGIFTDGATDVKMHGTRVGSVTEVELLDNGHARIDLFINDSVRIPDSATARIEPLSVFGPKYIKIDPGAGEAVGPYLADGDDIRHTLPAIEFTSLIAKGAELFETVDADDVVTILDTVSQSARGLGDELGATIDASSELASLSRRHLEDLSVFLQDLGLLSREIAGNADTVLSTTDAISDLLPLIQDDPERIERLLDATISITALSEELLTTSADEIAVSIGALDGFVGGVAANAEDIPVFLDLLGTFFGGLGDVIRMNGPQGSGTKMAALRGFIAIDLCEALGVCLPLGDS